MIDHNRYLPALTGIRALAAFWVLLYHLHPALRLFFGSVPFVTPVIETGYQGVDLFFVLSGFIIAHHYADSLKNLSWLTYRDYMVARIARIYPLHVFTLLTVVVMVIYAPSFGFVINRPVDYNRFDFIRNLFLIQSWQFPAHVSWNHFAWSISAEWFAYVFAPVFVAIIWSVQRRIALIVLAGLFLMITPLAVALIGDIRPSAYAIFRIVGAFGAGMVANRIYRKFQPTIDLSWIALGLLILSAWAQYHVIGVVDFLTVPFSVFLIFVLAQHQGRLARILSNRFFDYCGRISYSLYITQFIILMPMKKILPFESLAENGVMIQMLYLVTTSSLAFIAAIATYHVIEEPARRYLRRKLCWN